MVHTMEGWVTINPHVKPAAPPRNMSLLGVQVNHESLAHGGIYTDQELAAWEAQIQFQSFHQAVTKSVSYGICIKEEIFEVQNLVQSYDLNNLVTEVEESANVFKKINNLIKQYSGLIGVVLILGWTLKVIIYVTMITSIIIREGLNEAVVLIYATLCFIPITAGRILRKAKGTRIPTRDYPEEHKLEPVSDSFLSTYSPPQ